jgi:uncharacterized repeat protein (TIGR02543 family)
MKKVVIGSLSSLALACAVVISSLLVSCAPGLEPAWASSNAGALCVSLGGTGDYAPLAAGERAIMGGNGFLYVQTGLTAETAKVYGPYPASSGSSVTITDIPPGTYPEMAIFFLSSESPEGLLPMTPEIPTAEGLVASARSALSDAMDLGPSSSVAFVKDCAVVAGTRNAVQAVLIPTTFVGLNSDHNLSFNGNPSGPSRRFARIDGLSARFGNVLPGSGTVYGLTFANPTPDQLTLFAIGLYSADGKRVFRKTLDMVLAAGGQLAWSIPWTGADSYFLYAEFTGTSLDFSDSVNASASTRSVSFVGNGGDGTVPDLSAAQGLSVTLPSGGFSRSGYAFLGWAASPESATPTYMGGERFTVGAENVTLYAIWKLIAKAITIKFYPNGGAGSALSQAATEGLSGTVRTNEFTFSGNKFLGWSTDPLATQAEYADQATFTVGSTDLSLYAVWKSESAVVEHLITFNGNEGFGAMDPQLILEGSAATLSANSFTRDGYVFLGWSFVPSATQAQYADGNSFAMGTDDVTLYAVWAPEITVSFDANGATTGSTASVSGIAGKAVVLPANAFVRDGYSFLGWARTASATAVEVVNGALFTLGSSSETLYAVWKDTTAPSVAAFMIDNGAPGTIGPSTHALTINLLEAGSGIKSITLGGDISLSYGVGVSLNGSLLTTNFDLQTGTYTFDSPLVLSGTDKLTYGNFTLTTGDAKKTITATFKDAAGNVSAQVSDSIILDTQAPTMTFLTVRDAITLSTKYATNRSVVVSFTGSDATSGVSTIKMGGVSTMVVPIVKFNGTVVPTTTDGSWIYLSTPVTGSGVYEISDVELAASVDGATSVSAQLVDLAGLSYNAVTANITMDLNKPQLVDVKLMDQSSVNLDMTNGDTRMDITVDDSSTGVSAIKITASGGTVNLSTASVNVGGQSQALKSITSDTLTCALPIVGNSTLAILGSVISGVNGARVTVTVSVMDLAGNWSDLRTAFIDLDLAAPVFNNATSDGTKMNAMFSDASGIQSVQYRQSSPMMSAGTMTHLDANFGQIQTFTSSVPTGTASLTGLSVLTANYFDYIEMAATDYVGNVTAKIYVKRTFNGSSYVCAIEQ